MHTPAWHKYASNSIMQAAPSAVTKSWFPWVPLLVATFASYGPVGWNYGFALYFLNYHHGFVKRGLVGELFSPFASLSRTQLLTIEYLFLAAAFTLCYIVFRKALFQDGALTLTAVLLLSAPGVLPHIGYLFAQPDVTLFLLMLLCVGALLQLRPLAATLATLPLCCLGLMAHEAFSLMFYPLIAAILLHLARTRKLPWVAAFAHVTVVAAAFVGIVHFGKLKVSPDTILQEALARTNVGIQRQVYDVMASTLAQQQHLVHQLYTPGILQLLILTVCICLPYFWLMAHLLRLSMRATEMPLWQKMFNCMAFLSPLILCALGHDYTRWMGAACIDVSFFILYLALTNEAARAAIAEWATASPNTQAWLAYLITAGPLGATGIRSAELFFATTLHGK